MRLSTEFILVVVVGLTSGSVLALGALLAAEADRTSEEARWLAHSYEAQAGLEGLAVAVGEAEAGQRGYLLTGDPAYLVPYRDAADRAAGHLARLRELTASDPGQQDRLRELDRLISDRLAVMAETIDAYDARGQQEAVARVRTDRGRTLMDAIRGRLGEMRAAEERQLAARRAASEGGGRRVRTVAEILIGGAVVQMIAGLVLIRRDLAVRRRAEARLRDQATRDPLTGLHNRGELERYLRAEVARCHIAARPLAAFLVDVDHFKAVNDTHGHAVGDAVLRAVAARLAGAVREPAVVARYGGEEFAVLLPGLAAGEAAAVAERARRAIGGDPFAGHANDGRPVAFPIAASFGVAYLDPDAGGDADHLLTLCDRALYRAKRWGRNRVVVYDPSEDTGMVRVTTRIPTPPPRSPV